MAFSAIYLAPPLHSGRDRRRAARHSVRGVRPAPCGDASGALSRSRDERRSRALAFRAAERLGAHLERHCSGAVPARLLRDRRRSRTACDASSADRFTTRKWITAARAGSRRAGSGISSPGPCALLDRARARPVSSERHHVAVVRHSRSAPASGLPPAASRSAAGCSSSPGRSIFSTGAWPAAPVARSPSGAALDSILDRYVESALIVGLAWYYRESWVLVACLLALTGSLLVPYVRARGESLGVRHGGRGVHAAAGARALARRRHRAEPDRRGDGRAARSRIRRIGSRSRRSSCSPSRRTRRRSSACTASCACSEAAAHRASRARCAARRGERRRDGSSTSSWRRALVYLFEHHPSLATALGCVRRGRRLVRSVARVGLFGRAAPGRRR